MNAKLLLVVGVVICNLFISSRANSNQVDSLDALQQMLREGSISPQQITFLAWVSHTKALRPTWYINMKTGKLQVQLKTRIPHSKDSRKYHIPLTNTQLADLISETQKICPKRSRTADWSKTPLEFSYTVEVNQKRLTCSKYFASTDDIGKFFGKTWKMLKMQSRSLEAGDPLSFVANTRPPAKYRHSKKAMLVYPSGKSAAVKDHSAAGRPDWSITAVDMYNIDFPELTPVSTLVQAYARWLDLEPPKIPDALAKRKVSIISARRMPKEPALRILQDSLAAFGYQLKPSGKKLKLVLSEKARQLPCEPASVGELTRRYELLGNPDLIKQDKVNIDFPEPTHIHDILRAIGLWTGKVVASDDHFQSKIALKSPLLITKETAYAAFMMILRDLGMEIIESDLSVIILANGKQCAPEPAPVTTTAPAPAPAPRVVKTKPKSPQKLKPFSRSWVDSELGEGFGKIVTKARLIPFAADGINLIGFRITNIVEGSIIDRMTLQNNDVITHVGGEALDQLDEGFYLYQALEDKNDFVIKILRQKTEPVEIHIKIDPER